LRTLVTEVGLTHTSSCTFLRTGRARLLYCCAIHHESQLLARVLREPKITMEYSPASTAGAIASCGAPHPPRAHHTQ
jgi:hypothetical protein